MIYSSTGKESKIRLLHQCISTRMLHNVFSKADPGMESS